MPFELNLPPPLPNDGWQVKIYDAESRETPHITIIRGTKKWRIDLRKQKLMDPEPPLREVDDDVLDAIENNWDRLVDEWDALHPDNPV